eukprot:TRINITY_DN1590_c0_g1_i1.p1 TRINITY_DN1590_c0_g1~~TRINITY_DN1590_c0_g1_i1.p1  ORF type:complete len:343 (-),score=61.84 TRINITY_DN1590_c0_g1_i1:592-1620(-)
MIVPLLYSITMHEKHKLHAKFMQALKPCDSAVARVRGTGSKEASDKIMDIVLDCCGELFDLFATVHGKLIRAGVSDVTVQQAITELILERQYSLLWPHYCAKFFSQDDAHVKRVLAFANIVHLSHLGVPQKFWGKDTSDQYSTAITTLRKLSSYKTPYMKAQCIADTGKEITQFVRSLYKDAKERQQLAADDFLPLFAYVVIKAEMQHPYATTKFIEHFWGEDLTGEQQYMLITFETSLSFVDCLDKTIITQQRTHLASPRFSLSAQRQRTAPRLRQCSLRWHRARCSLLSSCARKSLSAAGASRSCTCNIAASFSSNNSNDNGSGSSKIGNRSDRSQSVRR